MEKMHKIFIEVQKSPILNIVLNKIAKLETLQYLLLKIYYRIREIAQQKSTSLASGGCEFNPWYPNCHPSTKERKKEKYYKTIKLKTSGC